MRRVIAFPCAGETLAGTLDEGAGTTGLLIVSGGNEIRVGAHRGMALLAQRVAAETGAPVLRYDRRGIGDSTGENGEFLTTKEDIAAAVAAFRAEVPHLTRIVAFGNCDAATALALFRSEGVDSLLLSNPWVIEKTDDLPPAAAIRARYAERLKDPKEWLRLARGGVNIFKLFKGLIKASKKPLQPPASLAARMAKALGAHPYGVTLLIAKGDNTAIAFMDAWQDRMFDLARAEALIEARDTASHSFASAEDKQWLFERVKEALAD